MPILLLPHLTKFEGVAREFVLILAANDITFLGILRIILCHVTDCFSSMSRFVKSPCNVSFLTLLSHFSFTSSFIERLTAIFAFLIFCVVDVVPPGAVCIELFSTMCSILETTVM